MPRVRLNTTDHSGGQNRVEGRLAVRIDTDVFDILSGKRPRRDRAMRPVIEQWLDCWSG
ncbi:hypothetical protein NDI85_09155 [Halomicroarcula sp. S1AR25-4]|uniref:hypothetical protein n=1 Tax=Haloarcula sp. S1AR25-4 TaxID=2950538 RepID=UPI002875EEC9|nr:hypothetical protein [Halomicroarcula sp. S1AR25-4]MDS0277962.1 hypothetical protein [Halomicroarcula sp. S1AR25-4]